MTGQDKIQPVIFFDGSCGLCHRFVTFVLKRDKNKFFNFAPQKGRYALRQLGASDLAKLPDSIFVKDEDHTLYLKANAVSYVLQKLGGIWYAAGKLYGLLPLRLANFLYDLVARNRYSLFGKKEEACPLVPEAQRVRFLT